MTDEISLSPYLLLAAIILISLLFSVVIAALLLRRNGHGAQTKLTALVQTQAEMQGRMQTLANVFSSQQAELNRTIQEQLAGLAQNLGQSINSQTRATHENLSKLQERLAVIDRAQTNIQSLAGQVVELQAILSNKQTRGAFGQGRMEAIIADGLPPKAYSFQATLSNKARPDCLVYMPNQAPSLVIDAKFPLESWNRWRQAHEPASQQAGETAFCQDMFVHIKAIATKYLIAGETQDNAFLFVPSESIFATIHERFEKIVEKAHQSHVIIVSPSLLMLSISVVQAILKDAHMREQAHLIQAEVGKLMVDVMRLDERVRKLQSHFGQANRDVDDILISSSKIIGRGSRIESLELGGDAQSSKDPVTRENVSALSFAE